VTTYITARIFVPTDPYGRAVQWGYGRGFGKPSAARIRSNISAVECLRIALPVRLKGVCGRTTGFEPAFPHAWGVLVHLDDTYRELIVACMCGNVPRADFLGAAGPHTQQEHHAHVCAAKSSGYVWVRTAHRHVASLEPARSWGRDFEAKTTNNLLQGNRSIPPARSPRGNRFMEGGGAGDVMAPIVAGHSMPQ